MIKKCAKKNFFSNLILNYKNNIQKTWDVVKEAIWQMSCNNQRIYPRIVSSGKETINDQELIAETNCFFIDTRPKVAKEIEAPSKTSEFFLKKSTFYKLNILWV